MDYTAKLLKGIYEVIENQKKIQKQNAVIIAELKKNNRILSTVHKIFPNVEVEDGEND